MLPILIKIIVQCWLTNECRRRPDGYVEKDLRLHIYDSPPADNRVLLPVFVPGRYIRCAEAGRVKNTEILARFLSSSMGSPGLTSTEQPGVRPSPVRQRGAPERAKEMSRPRLRRKKKKRKFIFMFI